MHSPVSRLCYSYHAVYWQGAPKVDIRLRKFIFQALFFGWRRATNMLSHHICRFIHWCVLASLTEVYRWGWLIYKKLFMDLTLVPLVLSQHVVCLTCGRYWHSADTTIADYKIALLSALSLLLDLSMPKLRATFQSGDGWCLIHKRWASLRRCIVRITTYGEMWRT